MRWVDGGPVGTRAAVGLACAAAVAVGLPASVAHAAAAGVAWDVRSLAQPTSFSPADNVPCESERNCDQYTVIVTNVGSAEAAAGGREGETLTCAAGVWENEPSFQYRWFRGGVELESETESTYTLTPADRGKPIQCEVLAANGGGGAMAITRPVVAAPVPFPPPPAVRAAPSVSGTAQAGESLTCSAGTWSGRPTGFAFQWLRNGEPVNGETGETYALGAADEGAVVQCRVRAVSPAGASIAGSPGVVVATAPSSAPPSPTTPPSIPTSPITVTDTLPAGVRTTLPGSGSGWRCPEETGLEVVTCTSVPPVPGLAAALPLSIPVSLEPGVSGRLSNHVEVSGGGAAHPASTVEESDAGASALPFSVLDFRATAVDAAGALETQAGAHPAGLATSFAWPSSKLNFTGQLERFAAFPIEDPKQIVIDLPAGIVGNPQAAPACPLSDLFRSIEHPCDPASQVGWLTLLKPPEGSEALTVALPIYNIVPERGHPAELGVFEPELQRAVLLYPTVRTGSDFGIQVISAPIPRAIPFDGVSATFFGDPGKKDGTQSSAPAFFTTSSDCAQPRFTTTIHVDSWQHPGRYKADGTPDFSDPSWKSAEADSPPVGGCDRLRFDPQLTVTPETTQSDTPSGYEVDLSVPQNEDPNQLATPPLRAATVTLPAGVSISPAAADGLTGCQAAGAEGIDLASALQGNCPASSRIGEAEVLTPLLREPLKGGVYLVQPGCGGAGQPECSEEAAETGSVFGLYLEVGNESSGLHIKLRGKVEVGGYGPHSRASGLQPGQIRTTFADTPQQPFSELKLKLNGGPRAPLANPQGCGAFTTTSALTPWSANADVPATPSPPFDIGGCINQFAPGFTAGTVNPQAGAPTPFTLTFSRRDREQGLAGITVDMPPGLLGKVAGIPQCPEAQANAGTCSAASRVGTATSAAGSGARPLWQSGPVYLTGPYKGAPFGLSVAVPAKAGPFNLGTIVVRAAIRVDPRTAQLTVTSDPLPQSIDGVPLRLQAVNVTIDRPDFMLNPTSCDPMELGATIGGTGGASVPVASRFQAGDCASLPFKPSFSASTAADGGVHGASLDVRIAQRPGEAAIHKVDTQLPLALPSRLVTLQKACTEAQFATNPAQCPPASDVGVATATTPVLNVPLTGPVYLVSHGGAAFPDLDIILQGEGVTIDLVGNTDIKKGITYSRFETVPDAPITSFELNLPGGSGAVLAAIKNLCAPTRAVTITKHVTRRLRGGERHLTVHVRSLVPEPLVMPTTITGQNGAVVRQATPIGVIGCSRHSHPAKKRHRRSSKRRSGRR
jgi:hypothetical protein